MKERKIIYRPIPVSPYDAAGTELWLEDMSARGLHLSKDGFFMGFASFEKGPARIVRYRLSAAHKEPGFFSDYRTPPEEELEICVGLGWEYVDTRGQFYLYRTADPEAPELNTDTDVHAMGLDRAIKREKSSLISSIILFFLFFVEWGLEKGFFTLMLGSGLAFHVLFTIALMLLFVVSSGEGLVRLKKAKTRLLESGEPRRIAPRRLPYFLRPWIGILLILIWAVSALNMWAANLEDSFATELSDYTGDPPFATMEDIFGGQRVSADFGPVKSTVEQYESFLAPVVYHWQEYSDIILPDGSEGGGGYHADYYECAAPWLAEIIAREFILANGPFPGRDSSFIELDREIEADFLAVFTHKVSHFRCAVIQKGSTVLCINFYESGGSTLSTGDWVAAAAESIG